MKILFCSDGSPVAENAVRFGALVAAACQAEVAVLGINERPGTAATVLASLRRSQQLLQEQHLEAELISKQGRPVREIVKQTEAAEYGLVVIGAAQGPAGGALARSDRAQRIVEAIEPPVLVVTGARTAVRRILLCSGGARPGDRLVEWASVLARRMSASVDLFHVMAAPPALYADLLEREEHPERLLQSGSRLGQILQQQKTLLEHDGVPCEVHVRHGLVIPQLLTELRQHDQDLVVVGSLPAGEKLRRYVLGDVAREIVGQADCPVLVVRSVATACGWWQRLPGWAGGRSRAPVANPCK